MTWSPLTTHWQVNNVDRSSRGGARIDSIGHHHAATTSLSAALSLFLPGGRTVTPNYCVWEDQIWGIVDEDYRAYTSGSAQDDSRSITYEIVNSSGAPHWGLSDRTIATVARLDADISARYGVPLTHGLPGYWEHRNLYEWFGRSYATACAGPSFDINRVIHQAGDDMPDLNEIFNTPVMKAPDGKDVSLVQALSALWKLGNMNYDDTPARVAKAVEPVKIDDATAAKIGQAVKLPTNLATAVSIEELRTALVAAVNAAPEATIRLLAGQLAKK